MRAGKIAGMFRRTFYDGTYSIDIFEAGHIGNGSRKGARPILVAAPCRPPAHEENGLSEAGEETIIVDMIIEEPVPGVVDTCPFRIFKLERTDDEAHPRLARPLDQAPWTQPQKK
jgi:hypothetical protein